MGFSDIFSGDRGKVNIPEPKVSFVPKDDGAPSPGDVAVMSAMLRAVRPKLEHAGFNPFPVLRRFGPQTQEDVGALLGLFSQLANPEFSSTDMDNLSRDVLRDNRLKKFFGF